MMGAAEVVPGVSGGTIAFVSGLYDRLVHSIQRLTPVRLWELRKVGPKQIWHLLDLNFLMLLFGSMFVSVLLFARGVSYLLDHQPVLIWSFFFGLVIASVYSIGRKLSLTSLETPLAIALGIAIGFSLIHVTPLESEVSPLVLMAGGCIAVCAWILPGLSGSFVLLVLGLYQTVIAAIRDFEVVTLTYVTLGCAIGLISFSRVLAMLLDRFHNITISVLVGFMLGSLSRIWPWKRTTSYLIRQDGSQLPVVQEPVLPETYYQLTGLDPFLAGAVVSCFFGLLLILLLDRFALLTESEPDWHEDRQ
jgi:putative membrane protein